MKIMTVTLCVLTSVAAVAQEPIGLSDISLEDLMQVEVTSVAKKPQRLANVAAAVHVITAEEIRLSGALSIPEALRLSPGLDATRISGNRWAVSIRGFANRLAARLLVLVDGRNAYTPAFSGVIWEDFQFPLENIERIEVLRGSAATVWGTNGVNGVINIITKSAAATAGGQAIAGAGTVDGTYGHVRFGGQNPDGTQFYRVYGSTQNAHQQVALSGAGGQDSFRQQSAGFRIDGYRNDGSHWDVSADFYTVHAYAPSTLAVPGMVFPNPGYEMHDGATLRARYEIPLAKGSSLQIQGAYALSDITIANAAADRRNTMDMDVQHRFKWHDRHDIVWGAGYRTSNDTMPIMQMVQMDEIARHTVSYGFFGQDEITLTDDWHLTFGLRIDHNEYTGWESQPDARVSWNLAPNHTLWGSLSKVARAPSRGEHGLASAFVEGTTNTALYNLPFGIVPNLLRTYSTGNTSEWLKVSQIGLRSQWTPSLSTDAVAFSHRYDRLSVYGTPTGSYNLVGGYMDVSVPVVNNGELTINGAELSFDWRLLPKWRLQLAQTWQQATNLVNVIFEAATLPRTITSLRSSWTPTPHIDIDLWLRHMGARPGNVSAAYLERHAFVSVDTRIAWRPQKNVEFALIGQNLNDGACDSYAGIINAEALPKMLPTCMPRSLTAQIRLDF